MRKIGLVASALLLASNSAAAVEIDGISFQLGDSNDAEMIRVSAFQNWDKQWFTAGNWLVTGFWEISASHWRGNSHKGNNQRVYDLGLTPVFRLQQKNLSSVAPYLEGAIGVHILSKTRINTEREFATAFQFGDHIGAGIRFGKQHQFDLGYSFQHLSNGSIKQPNDGIDFHQLRFSYHF